MREYLLYIKEEENTRQTYITPCFEVDKLFWEQRDGRKLHIIGKSPSLVMAFTLREKVNGYLLRNEITDRSLLKIKEMAHSYVREANQVYASRFGKTPFSSDCQYYSLGDRETSTLKNKQFFLHHSEESSVYNEGAWFVFELNSNTSTQHNNLERSETTEIGVSTEQIEEQAHKLLGWIVGRSLLWEEMEHLLTKHTSLAVPLVMLLQWLVLCDQLIWQPGVLLTVRKSWIRDRLETSCERCGSKDTICLTICHSCKQGCAYCSACLEMGRSKCCTPYLCVPAEQNLSMRSISEYRSAAERNVTVGTVPIGTAPIATAPFETMPVRTMPIKTAQSSHQRLLSTISMHADKSSQVTQPFSTLLQWSGQYSPMQAKAAEQARLFVSRFGRERSFLLWAVCGAGKTELLFPAVAETLSRGERVLIATPRKDVVLELVPRLKKVFPTVNVIAVHGSSEEKWEDAELVIATTHQVMRYYRRFPLVVVDEVDAFPFHNNDSLYRAVSRAVTSEGKLLYLSATPPRYLQKRLVKSKRGVSALSSATHVLLPARYHGQPLPLPRIVAISGLHKKLHAGKKIPIITDAITDSLKRQRQVFVFVPRIEDAEKYLNYFQIQLPAFADGMAAVHASDPEREQKVLLFREKKYKLLVTTTILERGVTIPRSDVLVLQADAPVFDEASLVQIAGRVGRSADSPDGTILFVVTYRTKATAMAVKQIKNMNKLAAKLGEFEDRQQQTGKSRAL